MFKYVLITYYTSTNSTRVINIEQPPNILHTTGPYDNVYPIIIHKSQIFTKIVSVRIASYHTTFVSLVTMAHILTAVTGEFSSTV